MGPAERRDFNERGYLVQRGAISAEILAALSMEVDRWLEATRPDPRNVRFRMKNRNPDGALVLDAVDPALDLFPTLAPLAESAEILERCEVIYGDTPCLFKDKLVVKAPGVAGYSLHQDFIAWPYFPKSFLTVVVPLDPATRENGCIEVFPGLHLNGNLAPADGDYHDLPETAMRGVAPVALELEPGDIAFFGGFVPHRSGPNRSGTARRQFYLSYNRKSELGVRRLDHYESYRQWLLRRYAEFGATGYHFA